MSNKKATRSDRPLTAPRASQPRHDGPLPESLHEHLRLQLVTVQDADKQARSAAKIRRRTAELQRRRREIQFLASLPPGKPTLDN